VLVAWCFSPGSAGIPWRLIGVALATQVGLGLLLFQLPIRAGGVPSLNGRLVALLAPGPYGAWNLCWPLAVSAGEEGSLG